MAGISTAYSLPLSKEAHEKSRTVQAKLPVNDVFSLEIVYVGDAPP